MKIQIIYWDTNKWHKCGLTYIYYCKSGIFTDWILSGWTEPLKRKPMKFLFWTELYYEIVKKWNEQPSNISAFPAVYIIIYSMWSKT